MASTLKADVFVPEVATEVATAEFPNRLALGFPGSAFVRPFPAEDELGQEGDEVKFPRWNPLGEFAALTEDVAMTPERLSHSMDSATVQVAGKAAEITDWADLASRGDISSEIGTQIATLAARYVDARLIIEAETTELSTTAAQTITWELFVDAIIDSSNGWGDKAMEEVGGLVVHSKVMGDLMKLPEFKRADQLGQPGSVIRGFIGNLATFPVFVSDRLSSSGSPANYTNLILKRGALGLKFQRQLLVETDRDVLKKSDVIAADVRFAVHLFYANPLPAIRFITR